jgi:uncharacterized protein (TIGR02757 family)
VNNFPDIKQFLDEKYACYNRPEFIVHDPISVPHQFAKKEDIEIAGLIAAIFAWGQRKTAISKANQLLSLMKPSPFEFLMNAADRDYQPMTVFVHRTFNGDDCLGFLHGISLIYKNLGGLEKIFADGFKNNYAFGGIKSLRQAFAVTGMLNRTFKHLPDPENGSAAKRINMFLRWMVRSDHNGVDFGIWKTISPATLICPLDLHVGNAARALGLLNRKQNDWRAAIELTEGLKTFDPYDPVKYDFALFGYSMFEMRNKTI